MHGTLHRFGRDEEGLAVAKSTKVEITRLTEAEFAKFKAATLPMWKEVAERSALSAKAVETIQAYMKDK